MFSQKKSRTAFVCIVAILAIVCMSFSVGFAESAYTDFALPYGIHFGDSLATVASKLGCEYTTYPSSIRTYETVLNYLDCNVSYKADSNGLLTERYIPISDSFNIIYKGESYEDIVQSRGRGYSYHDKPISDYFDDFNYVEAALTEKYGPATTLQAPYITDAVNSFMFHGPNSRHYLSPITVRIVTFPDNTSVQILHCFKSSIDTPFEDGSYEGCSYSVIQCLDYCILPEEASTYLDSGI